MPALLREDLYHPDGQILDEVYVYGSFVQSKMYRAGVRCTDCHNPHNLNLKAQGNALCVQCHQDQKVKRFEALKPKNYDSKTHHFHRAESSGAKCVNCHMTGKNFMVIDYRRDHSFRIPRPDLSEKLGTPNACTSCHKDKPNHWAVGAIEKWYGSERGETPHYGEFIKRGWSGQPGVDRPLAEIVQDTNKPAIVRAAAVDLLRRYGRAGLPAIVAALKDKSPMVRAEAVGGLYRVPSRHKHRLIAPLLDDPVRVVRVEAARVMASVPAQEMNPKTRSAFRKSIAEYQSLQMSLLDTPEAHLNLGVMYSDMGKTQLAEQSYKTAIQLDSSFIPARVNLANLYNRLKRNKEAENQFREAIRMSPKNGELHYSLGLLLAEEKKFDEAAKYLGKAARLNPFRLRVHFNHGLTLQRLGRRKEAEAAFRNAFWLNQKDPRTLQALAIFYLQQRSWEQAKGYAERLVRLFPKAPGPRRMLRQIQRQMKK
jgi:predicted CXXCH cytochrome family protein